MATHVLVDDVWIGRFPLGIIVSLYHSLPHVLADCPAGQKIKPVNSLINQVFCLSTRDA